MSTYLMLTTLTPEAVKSPGELKGLERKVVDEIASSSEVDEQLCNPRWMRLPGHFRSAQ